MARSASDGDPEQQVAGSGDVLEPQVLSLDEILRAYEQPINEEQAWAVCYQCCRSLHRDWPREQVRVGRVRELAAILLHRDGAVSLCGEQKRPSHADSKVKISPPLCTERQVVQSLGFAIYRALDWGLDENEERELSQQLEQLIDQMANNDSEGSNGTADEGYSGQDEEEEGDGTPRSVSTFEQVMKACAEHLMDRNEADAHFQAVCKALFVETLELQTFLVKIKEAKEMLKKMQVGESQQIPLVELDNLNHTDWARLWVQLMRDLRHGVKLKKVEEKQYNPLPTEYQLTPFEMLMQDIKARKYKLRKVMVDGDIPPCVKKNAHELILEFIRSRPPLKPVSERNLRPKPQKPRSLHERILEEIKSERKLRPVQTVGRKKNKEVIFGSLPCLLHACADELKSTSCIDLSIPEAMGSAQRPRPRVLLKAPTLAEMDEMCISEEEDSPSGEMRRVTSSPVPLKRDRSFSEHDLIQLQTELALSQSESAYLSSKDSHTKLYSGTESVTGAVSQHKEQNEEMWSMEAQRTRSSSAGGDILRTSRGISENLSKFSKCQLMEEFSHPVESLALTVEEIINVRKVLVKAEMEKFLQNKDLYSNLKKGKVCCCCKTKFPIFSWPSTCLFCKRSVCGSCSLKIKIPSKKLAHIPVYTLGFENIQGTSQTKTAQAKGLFQSQSLRNLSNRSVEQEFPHLYTHGCSFKDVCAECTKFVADVINSSRKSMDLLNKTPSRKVQSMYSRSTRS
ncbi:protein spire homolog 2 isoform X2 [Pristis pectinata]|uniref:protein spire homolog 2 isoform X2 n=1 Tax=Pristis pectinata TaxID=685728 RepID=UPI00223D2D9D|nr:protein spire homolog 2 isoform X2 [Pristis pectinata]